MRLCKMVRFRAFLRVFALFCAFLCVFFPAKIKFAQNRAKMCKKRFYAIPPLVIPPFVCHRFKGLPQVFDPDVRMTQGRPRDARLENILFGLSFCRSRDMGSG